MVSGHSVDSDGSLNGGGLEAKWIVYKFWKREGGFVRNLLLYKVSNLKLPRGCSRLLTFSACGAGQSCVLFKDPLSL